MREGERGMRTVRPISSRTSRVAGCAGGPGEVACADTRSAPSRRKASNRAAGRGTKMKLRRCTNLPDESPREQTTKKPHENWGWRAGVLSREEHATSSAWEGSLANGITADHSGGTTADFHGTSPLPEPASCENSLRREAGSVNEMEESFCAQISDFSSWACAFQLERASLPGSLPGGRV